MLELPLNFYGRHELFEKYAMHEYLIGPCMHELLLCLHEKHELFERYA